MTQLGVGPITALAFVLTIGDVAVSAQREGGHYLGLIPREHSWGGRQRRAPLPSRATALCAMLVEAAQSAIATMRIS